MIHSTVDDGNILESIETRDCMQRMGKDDNKPSVTQLNSMIKAIVERPNLVTTNFSTSLSNKLNALGPCIQSPQEWKKEWTDYKSKLKKFVDRNGISSFNNLQRLTYQHIITEECSRSVKKPSEAILTVIYLDLYPSLVKKINFVMF